LWLEGDAEFGREELAVDVVPRVGRMEDAFVSLPGPAE
jgi:hypothetical protein